MEGWEMEGGAFSHRTGVLAVPKDQLQVGFCSSSSGHRLKKQGKQFPSYLANLLLVSTLQPIFLDPEKSEMVECVCCKIGTEPK